MSKKLVVGDEVYDYPDTGNINYGEDATGWAEAITGIAAEVRGPGDIPTTETTLIGSESGGRVTGSVTNMNFDTAYVQSIQITGFITRTFTDATPKVVERFTIHGAFDGTNINYDVDYTGPDAELIFTVSGGQFGFDYLELHPNQITAGPALNDIVSVKFSAKALVDEAFFA